MENEEEYKQDKPFEKEVTQTKVPRREPQCPFRLLNILFSDKFAEAFGRTGDLATRDQLDSGTAGNQQYFWLQIEKDFHDDTIMEYSFLKFTDHDDGIFEEQELRINPGIVVKHPWHKLRNIWKSINKDYREAVRKYTQSGTHERDFWKFCNGNLPVLYLQKLLDLRPNLNKFVELDLPRNVFLNSTMSKKEVSEKLKASASVASETSSARSKKRRTEVAEQIGEMSLAIKELAGADFKKELAAKKIESIKQDMKIKKREDLRREKLVIQEEWESILVQMDKIRSTLNELVYDDEDKEDLRRDLQLLRERKNYLSKVMGYGMKLKAFGSTKKTSNKTKQTQPSTVAVRKSIVTAEPNLSATPQTSVTTQEAHVILEKEIEEPTRRQSNRNKADKNIDYAEWKEDDE